MQEKSRKRTPDHHSAKAASGQGGVNAIDPRLLCSKLQGCTLKIITKMESRYKSKSIPERSGADIHDGACHHHNSRPTSSEQ